MGEEALIKSDSRPDLSVVPVAISAIVQRRWVLQPKDGRKLQNIDVRTNLSDDVQISQIPIAERHRMVRIKTMNHVGERVDGGRVAIYTCDLEMGPGQISALGGSGFQAGELSPIGRDFDDGGLVCHGTISII